MRRTTRSRALASRQEQQSRPTRFGSAEFGRETVAAVQGASRDRGTIGGSAWLLISGSLDGLPGAPVGSPARAPVVDSPVRHSIASAGRGPCPTRARRRRSPRSLSAQASPPGGRPSRSVRSRPQSCRRGSDCPPPTADFKGRGARRASPGSKRDAPSRPPSVGCVRSPVAPSAPLRRSQRSVRNRLDRSTVRARPPAA
jgi:hypothetical protein